MTTQNAEIKKLHIHDTAQFALESIPNMHRKTIELLIELINADGSHGFISQERLMVKMRHILKYIPGTCTHSLMILVDLLEIPLPEMPAVLQAPADELSMPTSIIDGIFQSTPCHRL